MLRQLHEASSVAEPCITLVNGFYCVVINDRVVALDKTTGQISNENSFKPFDWTGSTFQLGKLFCVVSLKTQITTYKQNKSHSFVNLMTIYL